MCCHCRAIQFSRKYSQINVESGFYAVPGIKECIRLFAYLEVRGRIHTRGENLFSQCTPYANLSSKAKPFLGVEGTFVTSKKTRFIVKQLRIGHWEPGLECSFGKEPSLAIIWIDHYPLNLIPPTLHDGGFQDAANCLVLNGK